MGTVSQRLAHQTMAFVLAFGRGSQLKELTEKPDNPPAMPGMLDPSLVEKLKNGDQSRHEYSPY